MYLFLSKSQVEPDSIDIFEADQKSRSRQLLSAPGFLHRLVLKDAGQPGVYYYISVWRSHADHQAFKASPDLKAWEGSLQERKASFREVERNDCEIVVEDRAA